MTELGSLAELGSPEQSQPSQTSPDDVHMAEMASAIVPEGEKREGKGRARGLWKSTSGSLS